MQDGQGDDAIDWAVVLMQDGQGDDAIDWAVVWDDQSDLFRHSTVKPHPILCRASLSSGNHK